jgi:hypothetical protein
MTSIILNTVSVVLTFIVAYGVVYFVLDLIVGRMSFFNKIILGVFSIKSILCALTTFILINQFASYHKPW